MTNTRTLAPILLIGAAILLAVLIGLPNIQSLSIPTLAPSQPQVNMATEFLAGIGTQPLPPLSRHARLHKESPYIHQWLSTHSTLGCRWDCGDQIRYNCYDPSTGHWLFAAINKATDVVITAFPTSQGYGVGATRDAGCTNIFHPVHP